MKRSVDGVVSYSKKVRTKFIFLLIHEKIRELKMMRMNLQMKVIIIIEYLLNPIFQFKFIIFFYKIRDMVESKGAEVYEDFDRNRIVSKNELYYIKKKSREIENAFDILSEQGI